MLVKKLFYVIFFIFFLFCVKFLTGFIGSGANGSNFLSSTYFFSCILSQSHQFMTIFLLTRPFNNSYLKSTLLMPLT